MNIARGFTFDAEVLIVDGIEEVHITQPGRDGELDSKVVMTVSQLKELSCAVKRVADKKGG